MYQIYNMRRLQSTVVSFCVFTIFAAVCFFSSSAFAGFTMLGSSNWGASWDVSLDPYVSIDFEAENTTQVFIKKSAEFIQGPNLAGIFPTIPITFTQVGPTTVTEIVITNEAIINSTGHDWTDFHLVAADHGDASFNSALTDASSPSGFDTAPFDNQMWGGQIGPDLYTEFWVDGFGLGPGGSDAIIPGQAPGNEWNPGLAHGDLVIEVVPHATAPYTVFTLKETPTGVVPEPSAIVLMVFGAIGISGLASRRRW